MLGIYQWLIEDTPTVQNTTSWEYIDPVTETTTTTDALTTTTNTTESNDSPLSPIDYEPLLLLGGIATVALVIGVLLKKR